MPAAALPTNERQRLEVLERYAILDTLPEQQFDDLTFLASQICGTPISLISLLDDKRQWFKARVGFEPSETPRAVSFCAHTILDDSLMEVPDATVDARFADNDLVTGETGIRYYAGVPLVTPEGFRMGTLCVLGKEPRHLSDYQLKALEVLARQVMAQLDLMLTVRRLQATDAARTQALSHLAANAALLRQFVEHAPAAIAMLDRELRYIAVSNRLLSDFGLGGQNIVGMHHAEVFPNTPAHWKASYDRALCGAIESSKAEEFTQSDGSVGFIQWDVRPWRDARGQIAGVIMLTELISERVRAQRIKNEFVSVVSHELRTPLTSIRGALGLLAGGVAGELPSGARQMIEIAQKNSDRLVLLINDILDIEKIESGKMRFDVRPIGLRECLESAIEQNHSYAQSLGVTLEIEGVAEMGQAQVLGDEGRLQQVLSNLVSNACKFTPSGGVVTLRAQIEAGGEGAERASTEREGSGRTAAGRAHISVLDQGPGVPVEFVPRLFEKFAQADSSSTRKQGGTGLGLAIARAIVEKQGGSLHYIAPQEPRQGATFQFDLPLYTHSALEAPVVTPAPDAVPSRVLICEDEAETAALLAAIVRQSGFEPEIAATLQHARDALASAAAKTRPFVGLTLDLLLPDGNGADFLQELRAGGCDLPVVVVSAYADEGHLQGEALRVLDWLAKPLDGARLQAALRELRGLGVPRLLHVEDDADVRRIVAAILGQDALIVAASTLRQARQHLQNDRFDLAILDLTLPDGSGLDLVTQLSGSEPPTPIVLFSASETAHEQSQGVAASLVKSRTDNEVLRSTIRRFLVEGMPQNSSPYLPSSPSEPEI